MGPARNGRRVRHGDARFDRRQRRPPLDRQGPRCHGGRAPVGADRLPAAPLGAAPHRREPRRPLRPPPDLRGRRGVVRGVLALVCRRPDAQRADRRAPAPRSGRGAAGPGEPGAHRSDVRSRRPRPRHWGMDGPRRGGERDRAPGRWLARRGGVLAPHLRDQPSGCPRGPRSGPPRTRLAAKRSRAHRRGGGDPGGPRPGGCHVRPN